MKSTPLISIDNFFLAHFQIEASPVKSNQKSEEKLPTLIAPDEEKNLARELLDSETFRQNFAVIDGLTEFLVSVSEKFANRKWPISVSDVFLRSIFLSSCFWLFL